MKALAFGTFDLFHEGHKNFLTQATHMSESLVVFVPSNTIVEVNKGVKLFDSLETRMCNVAVWLGKLATVKAHSGTQEENLLTCVKEQPALIILGEDQLNTWTKRLIILLPLAEVVYVKRLPGISSTLLRKNLTTANLSVSVY